LPVDVRSRDVGREGVGRHLDPVVVEAGRPCEEVRQRRLGDAGNSLEQEVSTSQERDRQVLDGLVVADENAVDLTA